MVGLQANFMQRVLTGQAHIQLLPPKEVVRPLRGFNNDGIKGNLIEGAMLQAPLQRSKSIDQWQSIAAQVKSLPEVLVVSPTATGSALVLRGDASQAIALNGIKHDIVLHRHYLKIEFRFDAI